MLRSIKLQHASCTQVLASIRQPCMTTRAAPGIAHKTASQHLAHECSITRCPTNTSAEGLTWVVAWRQRHVPGGLNELHHGLQLMRAALGVNLIPGTAAAAGEHTSVRLWLSTAMPPGITN